MDFEYSPRVRELSQRLQSFMDEHIYPNEKRHAEEAHRSFLDASGGGGRYTGLPLLEELKPKARAAGLWNLFLPGEEHGAGLTNLEYAPLCEIMGRRYWSAEAFNCSAPDTGNTEVIERYGSPEQKARWLQPLLEGEIRSAFAMTEPAVASSDATNISTRIERQGDEYVINGRKWYITGAMNERCKLFILMGKSDPQNPDRHRQQSMIIVPADTPGITVVRDMALVNHYDAPFGHPEVSFDNVRVPAGNILLGEGRGFEIAQGRLGPGRIHHCMRMIGMAESALEMMCERAVSRVAFGKPLAEQGVWRERIARARMLIDQARWMVLHAAWRMDTVGNKVAAKEIAMIKVIAPNNCIQVIDDAMQAFGAMGLSQDTHLVSFWAYARHLRVADGPDEVHRNAVAKQELGRYRPKAG
ncbi:acyl-CoA dehydrogenase family protein [Variovorax sp. J22P168]|uniref:acyl-CoA dehydrogenase family protein n=1 Tax=Variovorax jilinensis TaxID=3053513 RepID=UPI0025761131|nr:acyl-CoA dehydrogenase family protein [Variovorax sp. J22P168]MDM0013124.1 acyl-CoA dehydrogenase family protein [Variovorax sp. J22P168]